MTHLIIAGHGGYGTAMREMLQTVTLLENIEGVSFVDFYIGDDIDTLEGKLQKAASRYPESDLLFACDLVQGSPYRQSTLLCIDYPNRLAAAGLSASAFVEMVHNLQLDARALFRLGARATTKGIISFPVVDMVP